MMMDDDDDERETSRARTHHPSSSDDPNLALAIETTIDDRCERRIAVRAQTSFSPDRWKTILKVHDSKREGASPEDEKTIAMSYRVTRSPIVSRVSVCIVRVCVCVYVQTVRETDDTPRYSWVLGFRV